MTTNPDIWVTKPEVGNEAVEAATGRDWAGWVEVLDAWGATERSHTETARYVQEGHGIGGWWAQSVTVGYERIRGMRKVNQRPDGFSMNVSRTVPVPVEQLFAAFVDDQQRAAWLDLDVLTLRTSKPSKSARFDDADGGILAAYFVEKGEKSAVQLQLNGIATEADLAERKDVWKSRLGDLVTHLRR